jgi:hypothetical protein
MPNGKLLYDVNYRKLNAITKKDRYPIPWINELLQRVTKTKYFTKLDVRQSFHHRRMEPGSENFTTFRARYCSLKYRIMPFGWTNVPVWQRTPILVTKTVLSFFLAHSTTEMAGITRKATAPHAQHDIPGWNLVRGHATFERLINTTLDGYLDTLDTLSPF